MAVVTPDAIPGIHDVNTLTGSESFELCLYEADVPGFRKVALRAQISTSLIGSGGGNLRMEEHAAELEMEQIERAGNSGCSRSTWID
ncbi:hypothetical protein Bca52824_067236 [Brassica carinata]|uniref:Uncharacterized protein n=1 Tax=Brassica carinata TaxID=52824 RepID=A0A8X7QMA3_BRACI|nr:hypothetical protein Bca52824_067236 [Brassica carinata]